MKNIKKIYLDRIDNTYNLTDSLALGPWCFHEIKEIDEIYSYYKNKHFKIIDFNRSLLVKSRKKFYKKNIIFFAKYIRNKNKLKDTKLKVITEFISIWVLYIHDIFYVYLQYVKFLKKKFNNKKILIIKYYKPINLRPNNISDLVYSSFHLNFFTSLVFLYLKKNKSNKWKFKCNNFELKEKKKFDILIIFRKVKLFLEKIFFSNVIDTYNIKFYQKLILSQLLKKK